MMIRILMGALVSGALCLGLAGHARAGGLEGKPAPSIQIESADGVAHSVAEVTKGRRSIVIFWASWCPFCKAVMTCPKRATPSSISGSLKPLKPNKMAGGEGCVMKYGAAE